MEENSEIRVISATMISGIDAWAEEGDLEVDDMTVEASLAVQSLAEIHAHQIAKSLVN